MDCIKCSNNLIGGDNWPDYAKKNYVNKCSDCLRVEKRREARVYRLNRTEEQIKNRKSTYIKHRERLKLDNPKLYTARQMSGSAKKRARAKGIDYNLSPDYIYSICTDKCPVFGVDLIYGGSDKAKEGASLDRVDSDKGYVKGNVWVISHLANLMKSNATIDELIAFGKWCESLSVEELPNAN